MQKIQINLTLKKIEFLDSRHRKLNLKNFHKGTPYICK